MSVTPHTSEDRSEPPGDEMVDGGADTPADPGGHSDAVDAVAVTRNALRGVLDPELGVDIVSLGLVYDVRLENGTIVIEMTLTTPGCPVSQSLPVQARVAAEMALGEQPVETRIVWDPPWSPDLVEDDARRQLGLR